MNNTFLFLFLLFHPILSCGQGVTPPLAMPPYLQGVTQSTIYVLLESASADTAIVEYGSTTAYGNFARTESGESTDASTYVHNVFITGLDTNTVYHYRALQGSSVSEDATFRTAPGPGASFRFAWMADCRTNTSVHDSIAARISQANPVVMLYGGDLCHNSSYNAFKSEFFRPVEQSLISRVPFFNSPGNHEGWSTNTKAFTQSPASSSGTQAYFSFDYGDLHVLVLNTEVDYSPGSPQYQFAQHDLAGTKQRWKIVIAHGHPYCAGGHGENAHLLAMASHVFEPNNVTLMLSGHSHFYQHNLVRGIHYLIIGSAGAPLYKTGTAPYTVKTAMDYNFGIFDVTPSDLRAVIYNEHGAVLDSLHLTGPPRTEE